MSLKLVKYFIKQPRLGTPGTSSTDGKVKVASFGSPRLIDERTVSEGKGVRGDLKMNEYQIAGEKLDKIKSQIAKAADESAAQRVHAALTFKIYETSLIADFGQGCEKSI